MRLRTACLLSIAVLFSCAPYKQLTPKPELSPAEAGYIELTKDKDLFKLKQDGKYFIHFPGPQEDNFYLVLNITSKDGFSSFLVDFYKGKKLGKKLADETPSQKDQSAYPVNRLETGYNWMIENVKQDMDLKVQYRYAPQWRFKFETKHAEYKSILEKNRADRVIMKTLGTEYHFNGFNFAATIDTVTRKSAALDAVLKELLAIESIFPKNIVNSTDKAYLDYKDLKKQMDEEIQFQATYLSVLDFFNKEQASRGDVPAFMGNVDAFVKYFTDKGRLPANVVQESQKVLNAALVDIMDRYEKRLAGKSDAKPLDPESYCLKPLNSLNALYQAAGLTMAPETGVLIKFVNGFDKSSVAFIAARDSAAAIQKSVQDCGPMPSNDFFARIAARSAAAQKSVPPQLGQEHGKYLSFKCATMLNDEIAQLTAALDKSLSEYREAERVVPQVNTLLQQRDFRAALGILKQNANLVFLPEKFRRLDTLSVQEQAKNVGESLAGYRWSQAESGLRDLNTDNSFLYPPQIVPMRDRMVGALEDSLYMGVDRVSRQKIDKFLLENIDTLENIDSLYIDSVFLPAYDVTFSTGSKRELLQRKADLVAHLAKTKEDDFPAKAITLLFEKFTKNPEDNGVLKARAIVAHGKHYTAKDEKVERRVAECDPTAAKWIVEAKQYRRLYALPVTDKVKGQNRYLFRINIRVPTEAQFPVYDVNIKLPKELAQNAGQEQWYEEIAINKVPLKNEGRFSITAPTASNEYECQITPVSVNKDKSNYLDVSFMASGQKVYVVSVMVQKPIIKKN